jgi:hypothetical protein
LVQSVSVVLLLPPHYPPEREEVLRSPYGFCCLAVHHIIPFSQFIRLHQALRYCLITLVIDLQLTRCLWRFLPLTRFNVSDNGGEIDWYQWIANDFDAAKSFFLSWIRDSQNDVKVLIFK